MEEKNRGLQWSHIEPYCLLRTLLRQLKSEAKRS